MHMATLMEKDVLIEVVAGANAVLLYRLSDEEIESNEDLMVLGELRRKIYSSSPEELDFDGIVKEVKNIKQQYQNRPIRSDLIRAA